jgi:hypothetical protein
MRSNSFNSSLFDFTDADSLNLNNHDNDDVIPDAVFCDDPESPNKRTRSQATSSLAATSPAASSLAASSAASSVGRKKPAKGSLRRRPRRAVIDRS